MSEWREIILGNIATIVDCEHKTAPVVENSEFYSVRTANISKGKIDYNACNRVSETTYIEWTKRTIPIAEDIVLAREAPVGEVGWVDGQKKLCLGQRTVLLRINDNQVDAKYILYQLTTEKIKTDLINQSAGSVVAHLNVKNIRGFSFNIHKDLLEQKAIASVLSSLDDKIDLIHRQNKILEKMAETLFRRWFVEEAKEKWKETTLYEAIELVGGGTPKTSIEKYWHGEIKWLSGGDIASNHKSIITDSEKTITEEGLNNSSTKLLPKFSTVISARGTVGKYCILAEPMAYSQSNYGIKPKFDGCYFFTYLLVNHSVEELNSAAYGSVFDTITTNTFKGINIAIPSKTEIQEFENKIKDFFYKILNNQSQIRTLVALRDTLLPKLMSGEVLINVSP